MECENLIHFFVIYDAFLRFIEMGRRLLKVGKRVGGLKTEALADIKDFVAPRASDAPADA
jgi:hypothetical protein